MSDPNGPKISKSPPHKIDINQETYQNRTISPKSRKGKKNFSTDSSNSATSTNVGTTTPTNVAATIDSTQNNKGTTALDNYISTAIEKNNNLSKTFDELETKAKSIQAEEVSIDIGSLKNKIRTIQQTLQHEKSNSPLIEASKKLID